MTIPITIAGIPFSVAVDVVACRGPPHTSLVVALLGMVGEENYPGAIGDHFIKRQRCQLFKSNAGEIVFLLKKPVKIKYLIYALLSW